MDACASDAGLPGETVAAISQSALAPIARRIDEERFYPEAILRQLGAAGAYGAHLAGREGGAELGEAITAMATVSEVCLSSGFCVWCQDALGWYLASSDNAFLKRTVLPGVATGAILGGTGMSNPMKAVGEIERMRLRGVPVPGGYRVTGVLPWVSNLPPDGYFGTMFEVATEGAAPRLVMAIIRAGWEGIRLKPDHDFVAMGGTATCNVQFRDVLVPEDHLLGDPAGEFVRRIRPGFTLLQCGMGLGIIRNCIDLIRAVEPVLGHVNRYLERQSDDLEAEYQALRDEVTVLARTPYDGSDAYYLRVLKARLWCGELSVSAAHWAQLHCGARGYVSRGAAQRRLREAYFMAIVTPATKHLRKLIAEIEARGQSLAA